MSHRQPKPDEVREALSRLVGSTCFEHTERQRRFISYVVEETLAGRGDRLKGYTIALSVFDRQEDFDAQNDPLVRVEAGRLRSRIIEYYADEGATDPVRITIPRGTYEPRFEYAPDRATGAQVAPATQPAQQQRAVTGFAVAAGVLAIVVLAIAWQLRDSDPLSRTLAASDIHQGWPRVYVAPFASIGGNADVEYFAYGTSEEIVWRLRDFELQIVTPVSDLDDPWQQPDATDPESGVDADYLLRGTVQHEGETLRISATLIEVPTRTVVWTEVYDRALNPEALLATQQEIAQQVVGAIAEPYGSIAEHQFALTSRLPPESLDAYSCVLRYYYYRYSTERLEVLLEDLETCFRNAAESEPGYAKAWSGLAMLEIDEFIYGPAAFSGSNDLLESARRNAIRALDIDGDDYFANLAMLRIRFFEGEIGEFQERAIRVLELGPTNPVGLTIISAFWQITGDTEHGTWLAERALALSPNQRGFINIAVALAALRVGDYQRALEASTRIDTPNLFMAAMFEAISAAYAGRPEMAARSLDQMLEQNPDLATNLDLFLDRYNVDAEMRGILVTGLELAGMEL